MIPSSLSWPFRVRCGYIGERIFQGCREGNEPEVPKHYFPDDDPTKQPEMKVGVPTDSGFILTGLNYFVYQTTPYELKNGVFVPVE